MNPIGQLTAKLDYTAIALKNFLLLKKGDGTASAITDFLDSTENEAEGEGSLVDLKTKVVGYGNAVITIATVIGVIIAVVGVINYGWSVLVSAKNPQERTENKKAALPVLIGCCIVGAAIPLVTFIFQLGNGLLN